MMFDDIKSPAPNVKELSNSPMKRPPEADTEHFVLKFQDLPPWRPQKGNLMSYYVFKFSKKPVVQSNFMLVTL